MQFAPRFCPNPTCSFHHHPPAGFARRHGRYHCWARGGPVLRYRCTGCRKTFSFATFRYSYRQKKPHVDATLMRLLCSGVSLRAAARLLGINRKTVFDKLQRLAVHGARLHQALMSRARLEGHFQLDELETFETNRFQPVTVPLLIEKHSYFHVSWAVAPMRRKGRMTPAQKKIRDVHESLHGRRPTQSDAAVRDCLAALTRHARLTVVLETDRKPSYCRIATRLLGRRLTHITRDSRVRRDRQNPLFPINHTNAMLRYCLARLKRRTWCVSKRRAWLKKALDMYATWFNYCRGITNRTRVSPAQQVGIANRKLTESEWLSWRQDWHAAGRILPHGLEMVAT